jgi:hypothetical protein
MTTFRLPDTLNYTTVEFTSCRVTPSARAYGSEVRFHPRCIRHAGRSACSEPSRWIQFVQLDQHKRLTSDIASASHAEGRWFDLLSPNQLVSPKQIVARRKRHSPGTVASICGAHLAGASRFAQLGRDLLQSVRHQT